MQRQLMPWEEDWSQQSAPASMGGPGYSTITIPRDPRQVRREDSADARAQRSEDRANSNAERVARNDEARLDLERRRLALAEAAAKAKLPGEQDMDSVRAEALDKIRLARSLQQRSRDGWFTTGVGAGIASSIGGTPAFDVSQDTETLKNAGALTRIMDMAKQNGGKNPLTPLSNSDFQALASSLSNLNTSQSDAQYQANVQRVIDLYTRAYQGAGGTDLEGDLDPSKRRRNDAPPVVGGIPGRRPPGGVERSTTYYGDGGSGGAGMTIADGGFKVVPNPEKAGLNARVNAMMRQGASDQDVRAFLSSIGAPGVADRALNFRRKNPGYKGGYSVDLESMQAPTSSWNRAVASPVGTGIIAGVDASMAGMSDEVTSLLGGGTLADLNARKQAAFAANPGSALVGQTVGTIGGMAGLGAATRGIGLTGRLAAPFTGDLIFGAASGAGQSNDNRFLGAGLGLAGAGAGNLVGQGVASGVGALARTRPGLAAVNGTRRMFAGRAPISPAPQLSPAEQVFTSSLNRAGVQDVRSSLTEAQALGVPMTLADTNSNFRELAGAAVRRSPTASAYAEGSLIPRNRGQYDRFVGAVERDLGPTTNIPQRSADLMADARAASAPLYDRAYAASVPDTPELGAVLGTPFGRQALGRARTIAANERRSPSELGFALDDAGNTVLNPRPNEVVARHLDARAALDDAQAAYRAARNSPGMSLEAARSRVEAARAALRDAERSLNAAPDPSLSANVPAYTTQTLDYVKRGMDDVLEERRNPLTGRLQLDEAGRAQNGVRNQLVNEVDRLNPDFAAARAAYAGPMQARDALARGQDAYSLHPDELGMQVGAQTPEHLAQMQLGYRGAMVDHAGRVRDASNPWEATLGSPLSRDRLGAMYPENPATDRLLRTRELEGTLQQTDHAVLGNSRTARNQIADQSFLESPLVQGAADVGASMLTGGVPAATMMRIAAGRGLRDATKLGLGKRAVRKADDLAPLMLNPDPGAGLSTISDVLARQQAYSAYLEATTPRRLLGMFGRGAGSQAAPALLNYW
ncbi:hypothetical protein SAMN05192580_2187 [Sphingomonas jatrophae]|uniref:Uncharacterized protein n=2 Tax=Sphingomonas jatrophae TaxID=1166337 RepID=A0A1I6L2W7_9SPHN|nr:hypothetical protein SAMN05192580_2187 [Sphingomonas jatrophae]